MNNGSPFDEVPLRLLDEIAKEPAITQRALAVRLGIALGLVNAYLKRLYKKGYIKVKTLPRNRIKYIITPKGFIEKTRLTYNYMHSSMHHFRDIRQRVEKTYSIMMSKGVKDIILWGDGEIAELCYIFARGLPLNITGVIVDQKIKNGFFDDHVYSAEDINKIVYDAILLSSIEDKVIKALEQAGIEPGKIYYI